MKKGRKLDGRLTFQGLSISIETGFGRHRHWTDDYTGEQGAQLMHHPYGYICGTLGSDGEHVDCFVGPSATAPMVFIVNQRCPPDFEKYDEQKVMLGFDSIEEAQQAYLDHYDDPRFLGNIFPMGINEFKQRVLNKERHGEKIDYDTFRLPTVYNDADADARMIRRELSDPTRFADPAPMLSRPMTIAELKTLVHDEGVIQKSAPTGGGWMPIPHGTHGGYRRRKGADWEYWYPGTGAAKEPQHPSHAAPEPAAVTDDWASGNYDKDATKWFPRPGPKGPPVAWVGGGIDPHSKRPVKVGGLFDKLWAIEEPHPDGKWQGYAKLREVSTGEIHYEPHNNIYQVHYDPNRGRKETPPQGPQKPWTPGGRPGVGSVSERASGERLKAFEDSQADPGKQPGLHKLEGGYFTWKEVSRVEVDEAGNKRIINKRVPGVPQHVKMQLLTEFAPLLVKTAKAVQRAFNLKAQMEHTADGRAKDMVREELTRSAQEGLLRAIDAYEGGKPFAPLAQLYVRDYARLHAAREFLGGIQLPQKHARNLSRFIAARAQAAKHFNVDEPSVEQVHEFFQLRKRDIVPELTGSVGQQPVPDHPWHPKAGGNESDEPQPPLRHWVEMYHSFLTGQKTAQGSEFFDGESGSISTGTGSGAGLSIDDRIAVKNAIGRALKKLTSFEMTSEGRKKTTYRANVGEMIKMRLGFGEVDEPSARAIARVVPIEVKRGAKWEKLGERQANDLVEQFIERGLTEMAGMTEGRAKEVISNAAERALPPVRLPQGPTFFEHVAERAKRITDAAVKAWREKEAARLNALSSTIYARAASMSGHEREVQMSLWTGAKEAEMRVRLTMTPNEIRKRIVMSESRVSDEMRKLATQTVMVEGSSPGYEYGRMPLELTDLRTGQKRVLNVRTFRDLNPDMYKARNDGNEVLSPAMRREATTWPMLFSTVLDDASLLGSAPTRLRWLVETMAGLH